jgi:quinoprotein glucose dehydrogenase
MLFGAGADIIHQNGPGPVVLLKREDDMRRIFCCAVTATALAGTLLLAALPARAQSGTRNGEWTSYGGDLGSTRYSPLDQINASNFSRLQVAWRFKTDNLGPTPEGNLEGTPLMIKGVL